VGENPLDDLRVFDAGDDLDRPAAALAALSLDPEHALQALRPAQHLRRSLAALRTQLPARGTAAWDDLV